MPIVEVKIFPGRDSELKKKIAKKIVDVFIKEANSYPEDVTVIFEDIKKSDWHIGKDLQ